MISQLFMLVSALLVQQGFGAGGKIQPNWDRQRIAEARDHLVNLVKEGEIFVDNPDRVIGKENNWDDCWRIFNHAKGKGWMNDADIADWKEEKAAPSFSAGRIVGVAKQCGCFHPRSMIDVFDPIAGKEMILSASEVVERRAEIALIHLDRAATADNFLAAFSPIKITTHGKEMFDLVVINLAEGKSLRLTRGHGVFVFPGIMKKAIDVTVQDKLYDRDGQLVEVLSLASEAIEDEVVNFETNPDFLRKESLPEHPLEHIIFAEGIAVGDLSWQNRLGSKLGQLLW